MTKNICIILIALCLLVCFAGSACSNKTAEPHITNPTAQSGDASNTTGTNTVDPGNSIEFDSVADIPKFISAVKSQEKYFSEEYAQIHACSETSAAYTARKFADNCSDIKLFCPKSDIVYDSFVAYYSELFNSFDVTYRINGVSYIFDYRIGSNTPFQHSDKPVLRNVKVGPFEIDLYQGTNHLVGSVIDGTTTIIIRATSEQINDINFDVFTIIDLSEPYQGPTTGTNDSQGTDSPIIEIETPADTTDYHFFSYADLAKTLISSSSDEFKLLRSEQARYGTLHTNTLSLFASGDIALLAPEMNGEPIPLRDLKGYAPAPISYMTSGVYGLPWIWYYCTLNDSDFRVQLAYPSVLNREEISSATTYLDVLKLIAPDAPSPSNYQEYASCEKIYEKAVTLADGQVVTAMFSELKNSTKIYVMLYIDDVLVCMYGEAQLFSDAFWAAFDLAPQGT